MKPYILNLVNATALILLGLWGYFGSESPSFTALIPVIVGVPLILMNGGLKKENKVIAHVVVTLTLILFIALFKPLTAAIGREDSTAMARVTVMMLTSAIAMVSFIKSFIDARKRRA